MGRHRRRGGRGGVFPGIAMIVVGVVFLLDRFDVVSFGRVWQLWPLFLVWIGLVHLFKPDDGRRSIFLLLLGVWLQISTLRLFGLDFSDSWPLLIIFVGASLVFDALVGGSTTSKAVVKVGYGIGDRDGGAVED